uniref:Uncharacterized protein n=1 Tax=Hucho hucho TaxID=62062 RepID=A0A4W5M6W8_9TELE
MAFQCCYLQLKVRVRTFTCVPQALSQDLLRVSARLGDLDQELERGGVERRLSSSAAGLCGVSMEELLKERESLRQRRDTLDTQLRDGRVLMPEVLCLQELEWRLQLQSGEREAVTREMEAALQRLTLDTDRQLTEQHQEHQHNKQILMQQLQEGGSGDSDQAVHARLQQLERDLFFYKSSSRELKRKLQELVTDTLRPQAPDLQTQGRKEASDRALDSPSPQTPRVELAPVRLSCRELRQISPSAFCSTRWHSTLRASRGSFQEDSIEVP